MYTRFRAVALGAVLVGCTQSRVSPPATPAPAAPAPNGPVADTDSGQVRPSRERVTLTLDGSHVLASGAHVADLDGPNLELRLKRALPPAGDQVFRLEVTPAGTYLGVTTLLQASTSLGWVRARLVTAVDAIELELADPRTPRPVPHLLLWPKLAQVGLLPATAHTEPIHGLTEIPFPYGLDLRDALFCERRDCSIVQVHAEPNTPFDQVVGPLHLIAKGLNGSLHARLISGPMPPPGRPALRVATTSLAGRLPPEAIQEVVRAAYGELRSCYENGLRKDPALTGKVVVRFVIGRDGHVSNVALDPKQTTLTDGEVTTCVMQECFRLKFPKPEGGVVTVVYPIMFSPSGALKNTQRIKNHGALANAGKVSLARNPHFHGVLREHGHRLRAE